jgi:hypothetical protein
MNNDKIILLGLTKREYRLLAHIVFEAFKDESINGPDLVTVMTINGKLNKIQDEAGGRI